MRLPAWQPIACLKAASALHFITYPVLDTVRIELDQQQLVLLWRAHFRREDPIIALTLGVASKTASASQNRSAAA